METDGEKHPDTLQIERVVRGEASRAENRALVRHLLHGCPQCQKMARKSFAEGSQDGAGGGQPPRRNGFLR